MSDTPRTDENLKVLHPGVQPSTWYVQADFARTLERDLAAALARAEKAEVEIAAICNHHCESQGCALPDGYTESAKLYADTFHAMKARAEKAEAERDALRADAERYWLCNDPSSWWHTSRIGGKA